MRKKQKAVTESIAVLTISIRIAVKSIGIGMKRIANEMIRIGNEMKSMFVMKNGEIAMPRNEMIRHVKVMRNIATVRIAAAKNIAILMKRVAIGADVLKKNVLIVEKLKEFEIVSSKCSKYILYTARRASCT